MRKNNLYCYIMTDKSPVRSDSAKDSVAMSGMQYYIIDFENPMFMLSQISNKGKAPAHLTADQMNHAFTEIIKTLNKDTDLSVLLQHLRDHDVIKTLLDRKRDMMLGPNTLRSTYVFPNKIMVPSGKQLKSGDHNLSMIGKRLTIDGIGVVVMVKIKLIIREISESEAITVFDGRPSMCVAGIFA
ncbi:TPA_asm: M [Euphorbia alphacytorhabdovirus 1]|nr:TPA_asm: M [Euphorbia alphacytorhabdovirus 1]